MKKLVALLLALAMVFALAACGNAAAPAATQAPTAEPAAPAVDPASADSFPTGTITFIVPYAAGDGLDLSCRAMLESLDVPVNVVVENISGGSGTILPKALQTAMT